MAYPKQINLDEANTEDLADSPNDSYSMVLSSKSFLVPCQRLSLDKGR